MSLDLQKVSCTHSCKYLEIQHYKFNSLYRIEGNFGDGKIWQMQHMNILGRIKFDELVQLACVPAHLYTFVIEKYLELL